MNIVELAVGGLGFLLGVGLVPILMLGIGRGLPAFLAEPLANANLVVSAFGADGLRFHQTEDDKYEAVPASADGDLEPQSYWTRLAMARFAISFESTKRAFEDLAVDYNVVDVEPADPDLSTDGGKSRARAAFERAGIGSYISLDSDADFWVPTGETLSLMEGGGGLRMAKEAISEALKEHGGNTKDIGPKWRVGGFVLFTFCGLGIGWVIFF